MKLSAVDIQPIIVPALTSSKSTHHKNPFQSAIAASPTGVASAAKQSSFDGKVMSMYESGVSGVAGRVVFPALHVVALDRGQIGDVVPMDT